MTGRTSYAIGEGKTGLISCDMDLHSSEDITKEATQESHHAHSKPKPHPAADSKVTWEWSLNGQPINLAALQLADPFQSFNEGNTLLSSSKASSASSGGPDLPLILPGSEDNTLLVTPTRENHYGLLQCWATNVAGRSREPCRIRLQSASRPERVSQCAIGNSTLTSLLVDCLPGDSGGSDQIFVAEIYTARYEPVVTSSNLQSDKASSDSSSSMAIPMEVNSPSLLTQPKSQDLTASASLQNQESALKFILKHNYSASDRPSWQVNGLDPDTGYTIKIYSVNQVGSSDLTYIHAQTAGVPIKTSESSSSNHGPLGYLPARFPAASLLVILAASVGVLLVSALLVVVLSVKLRYSPAHCRQSSARDFTSNGGVHHYGSTGSSSTGDLLVHQDTSNSSTLQQTTSTVPTYKGIMKRHTQNHHQELNFSETLSNTNLPNCCCDYNTTSSLLSVGGSGTLQRHTKKSVTIGLPSLESSSGEQNPEQGSALDQCIPMVMTADGGDVSGTVQGWDTSSYSGFNKP